VSDPASPEPIRPTAVRGAAAPRRVRAWDVALAVLLLVLAGITGVFGAFLGVFTLAFLDYCPPASCSADGAVAALFGAGTVALLLVVAGVIAVVVTLRSRRRAWWVGLVAFVLVIVAWVVGFVLFGVAIGG
jgi:hypothetical protein